MFPGVGEPPGVPKLQRILVWFRRDLRVEDNPALSEALRLAEEVVPIYIYAPEEEGQFQPGRCSRWWLVSGLQSLERDLSALGSRLLYFRAAETRTALSSLVRELNAQGVVFNHLYDPISMVRDTEVRAALDRLGVFCRSFNADVLREPWEVVDSAGSAFVCFDAFWAAHCAAPAAPPPPLPPLAALPPVDESLRGLSLQELGIMTPEEEMSNSQLEYRWQPGSAGARSTLRDFVEARLLHFGLHRAKADRSSTSRLSPHIHFGEIGARTVYVAALSKAAEWRAAAAERAATSADGKAAAAAAASVAVFLRQLGYREYSRYLSFHFPFTHERSLLEHLRAVPWRYDQSLFKAWRLGTTGYPLVDAGMREMWSTGWVHNRLRVVCASFLVKNLLLPWQWGLKHFWDALVDADLECCALGWQYCAGCLADAHAFGDIMDLAAESKTFDPDGKYVRRWLPVLARLPAKYIHSPWEAPAGLLAEAGVELGVSYPLPVIALEESQRALAAAVAVVEEAARCSSGGPFRPPTAQDPSAAERVWGSAGGSSVHLGGGGEGRPSAGPAPAAVADQPRCLVSAPAASEEVVSNMPAPDGGALTWCRTIEGAHSAMGALTYGASLHAHPVPAHGSEWQEQEGPQEPHSEGRAAEWEGNGGAQEAAVPVGADDDAPAVLACVVSSAEPMDVGTAGGGRGSERDSATAAAAGGGAARGDAGRGVREQGMGCSSDQAWVPEVKRPRLDHAGAPAE